MNARRRSWVVTSGVLAKPDTDPNRATTSIQNVRNCGAFFKIPCPPLPVTVLVCRPEQDAGRFRDIYDLGRRALVANHIIHRSYRRQ